MRSVKKLPIDSSGKENIFTAIEKSVTTTNHLMLAPLAEMQSDEKFVGRAREAKRLLSRCMRDNAETPWAYLARAELEYGLGLAVRQFALHPVAARSNRAPILPKF